MCRARLHGEPKKDRRLKLLGDCTPPDTPVRTAEQRWIGKSAVCARALMRCGEWLHKRRECEVCEVPTPAYHSRGVQTSRAHLSGALTCEICLSTLTFAEVRRSGAALNQQCCRCKKRRLHAAAMHQSDVRSTSNLAATTPPGRRHSHAKRAPGDDFTTWLRSAGTRRGLTT